MGQHYMDTTMARVVQGHQDALEQVTMCHFSYSRASVIKDCMPGFHYSESMNSASGPPCLHSTCN